MAGAGEIGHDASSLKPVSSLRSHFENINRDPLPLDQPARTPTREASPILGPRSNGSHTPTTIPKSPAPPPIPRNKPNLTTIHNPSTPEASGGTLRRAVFPAPDLSPNPAKPPKVLVEPPLSPPRDPNLSISTAGHHALLNPDSVVKTAKLGGFATPANVQLKPNNLGLEPRLSPRLAAAGPPSPPPPRRSGEIRRDNKAISPAPPLSRPQRPPLAARQSWAGSGSPALSAAVAGLDKISPFNSPPSSGTVSVESGSPPLLPTRPSQSRPQGQAEIPARPKSLQVGFEPPPKHTSVLERQRDRETHTREVLPKTTRSSIVGLPQTRPVDAVSHEMAPPPRPPRPIAAGHTPTPSVALQTKRHVSTPVNQNPPLPQRMQGRANTVSHRTTDRSPAGEIRQAPKIAAVATNERQSGESMIVEPKFPETAATTTNATFPDASHSNRQPPLFNRGVPEISTKYDPRVFDTCAGLVCATGHLTRVWRLEGGELLMSFAHSEGVKATAVAFRPGQNVDEEGRRIWIGNNNGDLMEADIESQRLVTTRPGAHGRNEVLRIHRHFNEFWTLDESGTLHVWAPGEDGVPDMSNPPTTSFRVPRGHTFSLVVGDELWHATGKEIRVFHPSVDGKTQFQVLLRSLYQEAAGDVVSGALDTTDASRILFGHSDGKVSIYSRNDHTCLSVLTASSYKINSMQCVGLDVWAGFNNGRISVFDTQQTPWIVKKDWQAHDNPVVKLMADRSSQYKLDKSQVVSLGADNVLRTWDASLEEYRLETDLHSRDKEYCGFERLKASVFTWNAGATTPNSLRYSEGDAEFMQGLLRSSGTPDIMVFGFQELVDLEDKAATAKSLLKRKKKDTTDHHQQMSHQYRDWRDFLIRSLDDFMPGTLYHLLQTAHLIGLFTCVFVKAELRDRISSVNIAEVKRGLGGLHGNKGGIAIRFKIDDTSLCFLNCHLAAGQTQAQSRHADIAAILEASILPGENDPHKRMDSYTGGGDGSMILDHELCILNGDLNYRIDTMSRDTVVMAVKQNNLQKLLERDQLLVARRRNPGFKLRAFEEMPITFAPTYKYDVGTDNYDSSEKKRSPAWCDRLLYRAARGRIEQLDYKRHEVRVSDHRPVTGRFLLTVKKVDAQRRAKTWAECQQRFEHVRGQEAKDDMLYYLTHVIGYDAATSDRLATDRAKKKHRRSPSRGRNWRSDA